MRTRLQAAIENESAHYSVGSWLISWNITHSVNGEALNTCDTQATHETAMTYWKDGTMNRSALVQN